MNTQINFDPIDWANHSPKSVSSSAVSTAHTTNDLIDLVEAIEASHTDIAPSYEQWFKVGIALASHLGEAGRPYFHRISRFYSGYNARECDRKYDDCLRDPNPSINIGSIFHYAKEAGVILQPARVAPQTMQQASPKKEKKERKQNTKINKLVTIHAYLCEHYHDGADLRNDLLSRKIQVRTENATWRDLTDKDICTITCAIAAATDSNITTADVHTVLKSDFVRDVHPLRDWLHHLPGYRPVEGTPSPIDSLAAQVHVVGDQALWLTCFRKWFVAMVASWLFDDIVNHQVLVLISEKQGIYKTTWLEHLIPQELRQYLTKMASARELGKDDRLRTAEFGLINMDEIDSMSPRELNVLKSVITSADVNERAAYGRTKERRVRCASFCASGNNRRFLSDDTGNRRWLPFEVQSIEDPWESEEPYEGIYAEAIYLINNGFKYWFSQEETRSMTAHTDEFRAQSNEEELLPLYFAAADKDSVGAKYLSASEIQQVLIDNGHIMRPMPISRFGGLLQRLGFVRHSIAGGRKGYLVTQNDGATVSQKHTDDAATLQQQLLADAANEEATRHVSSIEIDSRQQDSTIPF